jgi:hypothetical protein
VVDLGRLGAEILVRKQDALERQRYTIAHELGHWVLHLGDDSGTRFQCTWGDRNNGVERWCERFGAELLMPEDWIRAELRSVPMSAIIDRVLAMPRDFEVSREALRRRVAKICSIGLLTVRWAHDEVAITETYVPARCDERLFAQTTSEVLDHLERTYKPVRLRHRDTGFLSVHRLISPRSAQPAWFVCIYQDGAANSVHRTEVLTPGTGVRPREIAE